LPKWTDRTLIGQELWDYVTTNPHYHDILMNKIRQVAESLLGMDSIVREN